MADVQEQQEQRGLYRPGVDCEGALLSAGLGRGANLRKTDPEFRAARSALCAGNPQDPQPVLGADASEAA